MVARARNWILTAGVLAVGIAIFWGIPFAAGVYDTTLWNLAFLALVLVMFFAVMRNERPLSQTKTLVAIVAVVLFAITYLSEL